MARINEEKERNKTELDSKPTGKEIFLANKTEFEDLTLDEEDTTKDVVEEEAKVDDEEEPEEDFKYDPNLFDAEAMEHLDEDFDFDDEP